MKSEHPTVSKPSDGLPNPSQYSSLSVTESDVRCAVLSFPSGSAGGPDGLRPQHLRDLMMNPVMSFWAQ